MVFGKGTRKKTKKAHSHGFNISHMLRRQKSLHVPKLDIPAVEVKKQTSATQPLLQPSLSAPSFARGAALGCGSPVGLPTVTPPSVESRRSTLPSAQQEKALTRALRIAFGDNWEEYIAARAPDHTQKDKKAEEELASAVKRRNSFHHHKHIPSVSRPAFSFTRPSQSKKPSRARSNSEPDISSFTTLFTTSLYHSPLSSEEMETTSMLTTEVEFDRLMSVEHSARVLFDWMDSQLCSEAAEFYLMLRLYDRAPSAEFARHIYTTYVAAEAAKQVNVCARQVIRIAQFLDNDLSEEAITHLFFEIKASVRYLILTDLMPRFMLSSLYQDLIDDPDVIELMDRASQNTTPKSVSSSTPWKQSILP